VSILSTFYEQLFLHADPKREKDTTDDVTVLFALLGSVHIKAVRYHVDEIDPRIAREICNSVFLVALEIFLCSTLWKSS